MPPTWQSTIPRRLGATALGLALVLAPAACGDDPGEDEIGDNEVIDEGD